MLSCQNMLGWWMKWMGEAVGPGLGLVAGLATSPEVKRGTYPGFDHQLLKPTTTKLKQVQAKVAKRWLFCPETFVGWYINLSLYEIIIILSLQPMCAIVVVVGQIQPNHILSLCPPRVKPGWIWDCNRYFWVREQLQIGLPRCLSNTAHNTDGWYFSRQKAGLQNRMHIAMLMGFHP